MKKLFLLFAFLLITVIISGNVYAQLSGDKSIPGDYSDISAAITALNSGGVGSGGVRFLVAANHTENTTAQLTITATGTSANTITFQKNGSGSNPKITRTDAGSLSTSSVGGNGDAVIRIDGTDYITFDGIDLAASQSGIEYGYYTYKPSGTNGCQYVTIKNCVVTMTKSTSPYVMGIYISNGPTAVNNPAGVEVSSENGKNKNITVIGNTVQNVHISVYVRGWQSASYYDTNITIGQSGSPNILQNFGGGSATPTYGVYFNYVNNPFAAYNTINNAGGGGTSHGSDLSGIFYANVSGNVVGSNNAITLANNSTSSITHGIYNMQTVTSETFDNNTFAAGTLSSTGNVYLIYASGATNNKSISGNSTSGTIGRTGTSGTFYGYYNNGNPAGGTETIANNTFSGITITGTSVFYGLYSNTGVAQNRDCYGNTVSNITGGNGSFFGIYMSGSAANQVYNNNIHTVTIKNVTALYFSGTNPAVYGNSVYNISASGTTLYGIHNEGTGTTNCYKNRVYNLTNDDISATLYGFYITTGTSNYVYNNYISDLKTPNSGSTTGLAGMYISGGTSIGLFYNTIYLSTTSGGSNWGSSGIYASITPAVELRNNIIVNTSTPKGTGITAAYRRENSILITYANASNNNCFYAGTPGAGNLIFYDGTNSKQTMAEYKIMAAPRDAASFSELPPFQDITTAPYNLHLKTDQSTQCESGGSTVSTPNITDDYDGHARYPNTGYPDRIDYPATAPDVGADEFAGIPSDRSPPTIIYTALQNSIVESGRVLTDFAAITDMRGVNTTDYKPRIYYKKSSDNNAYAGNTSGDNGWKYSETTSSSSPFSFTIDYSIINGGSVSVGDVIQYFITAEDLAPTPNVGINWGTFAKTPTHCALDSGDFPIGGTINSYTILGSISGTFTIGATGNYATLTAAVADYNSKCQTGPVVFSLIDASYSTSETYPIVINQNPGSSTVNTLTIKPASGTTPKISGSSSASAIIKLNGADYVIIDGSNTSKGTDRSLTIENTNSTSNSNVIWLASLGNGQGATYNTIKNCKIRSGKVTESNDFIYGIFSGGTSVGTGGADNHNLTISNNTIEKSYYAVYIIGLAYYSHNSVTIEKNSIGSTVAADYVGKYGIFTSYVINSTITENEVYNMISTLTNPVGIYVGPQTTNTTISKNNIHALKSTGTGFYGGKGMNLSTDNSTSGITVVNNLIYDISGQGNSGINDNICGIRIENGGGYNIFYNTVNLYGTISRSSATADVSGAIFILSGIKNLNIRNNILVNGIENTTGAATAYAIYTLSGASAFLTINYNDYYAYGNEGVLGYLSSNKTTLSDWQTASGGDGNSLAADPQFKSTTDLRPALGSSVLDAGTPITGITTDYLGVTRSGTTPSMGAYENGVDISGPTITYTPLPNATSTSNRTLTDFAEITDTSGVNVSDYKPRIYYKKSTDNNTYVGNTSSDNGWKFTETSSSSTPFSFTIDYSIINGGSVSVGDVIQYFIVAQDLQTTPYVGINSGVFNSTPSNVQLTSGAFPLTGTIRSYTIMNGISGTFTVGSGGNYTTLTAAVNDYNGKMQDGPVVFSLIDASYTSETLPISINQNLGTNATNTLTIKPAGSTTPTISGSSTSAVIKLNGADYVIIDGSNTSKGTDRNLTIENTGTGYNTCAIWVSSLGTNAGATNNIIKNCNIKAGANSTDPIFGIFVGGTSVSKTGTGADNDNLTIQNNQISKCYYGIYASGIETTGGELEGLTINGNKIGSGSSSDYVYYYGMYLRAITGFTISGNEIYNLIKTGDKYGMHFDSYISNGVITKNNIHSFGGATSSSSICIGIYFYSSTSVTNNQLDNNIIYNLSNYGSTNSIYGPIGIKISGGTGYKLYYNSISLTGAFTSTTAGVYSICLSVTTPDAGMYLKNNIFYNAMTGNTPKTYTVYVNSGTPFTDIDFNDYYTTGSAFGYYGSEISNFNAWKTATGDDASSLNVDPAFLSSTDLRPALGSAVLASGTPITGITTDYLGIARNGTNPSMGAYEYGWDDSPPVITYTVLGNTTSTSDRTLSGVTITDAISGVDWTNLPRIYYKKSTDANAFVGNTSSDNGWKYKTANVGSSPTNFTIDYSIIYGGSVSLGDYVQYFVVAQDLNSTPNVGSNPSAGFEGTSVSSVTSAPTTSNQYKIIDAPLAGTYTVGIADFNKYTGKNLYHKFFTRKVQMKVEVQNNDEQNVVNDDTPESIDILDFSSDNLQTKENSERFYNNKNRTEDKKIVRSENRKAPEYKIVEVEEKYSVIYEGDKPYEGPTVVYADDPIFKKSGNRGDEPRGAYTTITAAVADAVERGISDDVIFSLVDTDYPSETFPITVTAINGASADNTVTIKPASSTSMRILGTNGTAIFLFDGAAYFNIDGDDPSSAGTKNLWIFNDAGTGPVIKLINGSNNIIVKNCRIIGKNTSSSTTVSGLIHIGASTAADGNSYNTVSGNIIRDSTGTTQSYYSGIYSYGTSGKLNSYNRIENNYISNFAYSGVYIDTYSGNGWIINGNHLYNNRTTPPSGNTFPIYINSTSSNADSVLNNYIGGQSANCGGSAWSNSGAVSFYGIRLSVGSTTAISVQGNTIQNINLSNTGSATFSGIYHSSGLCNIGTTTGNIIGNTSNSNIISIAGTGSVYGIYSSVIYVTNIQNNIIGYISQTTTGSAGYFYGIRLGGSSNKDLSRNNIFNCGPTSSSTGNSNVIGIYLYGQSGVTMTYTVSNNQISLGNGMTNNHSYMGITDYAYSGNNILLYYNSVFISGVGNGASNTYSYLKNNTSNETHRNNIYYNERTNSSTGKNYAIGFTNTSGTNSSDYNLFVSSSASTIGIWSSTDRTLAEWKTSSGGDANSYGDVNTNLLSSNLFVDLANGNLNIIYTNPECWSVNGKGLAIASVDVDYSGNTRGTTVGVPTDIGSNEFTPSGGAANPPTVTISSPTSGTNNLNYIGRTIAVVNFTSEGRTLPSELQFNYYSGVTPPGAYNTFINSYWGINATGGSGYEYSLTLNFSPAEIGSITPANLRIAKSNDNGATWTCVFGTVSGNSVTVTGLTSFSTFTLTDADDPLPVELASFTSSINGRDVELNWATAVEVNNSGFDIERKLIEQQEWSKIGFVKGNNNSTVKKTYRFDDKKLNSGKYNYRLKQIDNNGNFTYHTLSNVVEVGLPTKYDLSQNYPNPFNPSTKIDFSLPFDSRVTIIIYDITGREIMKLLNSDMIKAGFHTVTLNGSSLASGTYIYRFAASGNGQEFSMSKKMVLVK